MNLSDYLNREKNFLAILADVYLENEETIFNQ